MNTKGNKFTVTCIIDPLPQLFFCQIGIFQVKDNPQTFFQLISPIQIRIACCVK